MVKILQVPKREAGHCGWFRVTMVGRDSRSHEELWWVTDRDR